MMKSVLFIVAISVATSLSFPSESFAQRAPDMAPVTGIKPDRTTAPLGVREAMQKREAVIRQKRADCRAKAKAEKVSLLKRPAYVKRCVASSN